MAEGTVTLYDAENLLNPGHQPGEGSQNGTYSGQQQNADPWAAWERHERGSNDAQIQHSTTIGKADDTLSR